MNARVPFASMQFGAVAQAWWLLPEEIRTSIIESIGKAMNSMIENEEREVRLLEESLEHRPQHVDDQKELAREYAMPVGIAVAAGILGGVAAVKVIGLTVAMGVATGIVTAVATFQKVNEVLPKLRT